MADFNSLLGNPAFTAGISMLGASRDRRRDPFQAGLMGAQMGANFSNQQKLMAEHQQEKEAAALAKQQQQQMMQQFMQSPEFQSMDPLSQQYIQATGDMSAIKAVMEQRQQAAAREQIGNTLNAFGQNPSSMGEGATQQYAALVAAGVDPAVAKNAVGMANPDPTSAGGGIGQYNPRDYTTESWAQFLQTTNPADLRRFDANAGDIPAFVGQAALDASTAADRSFMESRRYQQLSDALLEAAPGLPSGTRGSAMEFMKSITGNQDYATELRRQYQDIRVSSAINNLPPGVASDKDIALVMSSTLDTYANPETLASYLRGLAKGERVNAEYNQFRADYLYRNGNAQGMNEAWKQYAETNAGNWGLEGGSVNTGSQPRRRVFNVQTGEFE